MPTKIIGLLADTNGSPVNGFLTIKLNAPLIDRGTTPDTVLYSKPDTFEVVNGDLSNVKQNNVAVPAGIVLRPSSEPTYTFEFKYPVTTRVFFLDDGQEWRGAFHLHTDSKYYTGEVHSSTSILLIQFDRLEYIDLFEPFNAGIPDQATIEWADLQHSHINVSNIDTSLYYIAQLLTQGTLLQSLVGGIYNPRGVWSAVTVYTRGDVVYDPSVKGSFWYINFVPSAGTLTSDASHWQLLITSTEVVGGEPIDPSQFLLNQPFGASWNGVINRAPTADVLYDQMILYARLADATFTTLRAPTRPVGTNTTDVATMAALQAALAAFTSPPSTTAPNLTSFDGEAQSIINQFSYKRMYNRYFRATQEAASGVGGGSGSGNRSMTHLRDNSVSNPQGSQNLAELTGGFVQLRAGSYFVRARAASRGTDGTRHDIVTSTGVTLLVGDSVHPGMTGRLIAEVGNTWGEISGRLVLDSTLNITLRSNFQTTGDSTDRGRPAGRGGNEIYAQLEGWLV